MDIHCIVKNSMILNCALFTRLRINRSIDSYNNKMFMLTIHFSYSKNFITMQLLTIEHMVIFVVKCIHIPIWIYQFLPVIQQDCYLWCNWRDGIDTCGVVGDRIATCGVVGDRIATCGVVGDRIATCGVVEEIGLLPVVQLRRQDCYLWCSWRQDCYLWCS